MKKTRHWVLLMCLALLSAASASVAVLLVPQVIAQMLPALPSVLHAGSVAAVRG